MTDIANLILLSSLGAELSEHVADVLSRFPFVHDDARFLQMLQVITGQADEAGRFTATSMYRAWKGYSFADKKRPSPWLSFLVWRIGCRLQQTEQIRP